MVVQLLDEVVGTAVGVLIWSFICLAASALMIWLVWAHHERDSYVALLSYVTLLGTVISIIQQFHTIVWWRDVKTEQYKYAIAHIGSPEIAIAGPSTGLDLVLFYIQYYTYNVEAMLTLFWAIALSHTVFKVRDIVTFRPLKNRTDQIAKVVAVILPAILMGLLRLSGVQSSHLAFLILANFNIMISLSIGSLLLIAILIKYIYTRHRLISWNTRYLFSRRSGETDGHILDILDGHQSIYDRWLVLRFSIAFVVLAVFQLITILSEISQLSHHTTEQLGEYADLSAARAINDFLLFMPGVSTSLLVFIVFGTTRTFRKTMYKTFVPKKLQKQPVEPPPITNAMRDGDDDEDLRDEEDYAHPFHDMSNNCSPETVPKSANDTINTTTESGDNGLEIEAETAISDSKHVTRVAA